MKRRNFLNMFAAGGVYETAQVTSGQVVRGGGEVVTPKAKVPFVKLTKEFEEFACNDTPFLIAYIEKQLDAGLL